jgi:hypothetical protein
MPSADFTALRHRVLHEPALQQRLVSQPDPTAFPAVVAELAATLGLTIDPEEVVEELRRARLALSDPWT